MRPSSLECPLVSPRHSTVSSLRLLFHLPSSPACRTWIILPCRPGDYRPSPVFAQLLPSRTRQMIRRSEAAASCENANSAREFFFCFFFVENVTASAGVCSRLSGSRKKVSPKRRRTRMRWMTNPHPPPHLFTTFTSVAPSGAAVPIHSRLEAQQTNPH